MPVTFLVRAAVPEDAAGIASVHVAGWQVGYQGLLPGTLLSRLSVEERTARWHVTLTEPSQGAVRTVLAEEDGSVVGFASVGPSRDEDAGNATGELWAIYVHPDHWGSGAGHALHQSAMQLLRDAGRTAATLWVLAGNERAALFYARHGWTPDGATKTDWRDDVRLDEVRYRLDLTSQPAPRVHPGSLPLSRYHPRRAVRHASTEVLRPAVDAIDCHSHLGRWLTDDGSWMVPDVSELLDLMDRCGVRHVVNLDGRWGDELHANLERYDRAHPERFSTFCHVDFGVLERAPAGRAPDLLVAALRGSAAAGARGLKVWKDLGLRVRDGEGALVLPDDDRLAPLFGAAGELGLPVLVHVADPLAFFQPLDERNERLEELADHPDWWFGRPGLPTFDRLIDALEAVIAAHPGTTFVGAHVGCAAEDLARVGAMLDRYPNYCVDLGARMAELGRVPRAARRLVVEHPDQVLFGTDELPLSEVEYRRWFRFLESDDECFDYGPESAVPVRGRWDVSALDLPAAVLPRLYRDNAARVLGLP